jgi:hypothetical protein
MDIAFGDCVLVGRFGYSLILVDHATWYKWTFGLQTLSSADIISALCLFRAAAGSLVRCFYLDCDLKLFGSAGSKYLIDGHSKVVAAPAKHQLANGLVESHWKVMAHMACAYLTKNRCLCHHTFGAYDECHSWQIFWLACIPIPPCSQVEHDKHTWVPLFSLAYFHHKHDGNI